MAFLLIVIFPDNNKSAITINDYAKLVSSFNKSNPGSGRDILSEEEKDRPMAYGLILSALAHHHKVIQSDVYITEMRNCGDWLLKNSDLDEDNIRGFGLADAWDAFGDGSINPPHQEYTITTAIAIKGLLDWLDADTEAPRDKIKLTVSSLLRPYLSGSQNSPSGIYSYSLNSNDLGYNVFNPAAFLAGQMQRYSQITEDEKEIIQNEADRIMRLLTKNHLLDHDSNWFWNYGQSNRLERPNDLIHAIYIMEGIREYSKYNGRESDKLIWPLIRGHLFAFFKNQRWCEHPDRSDCHNKKVRLWAMGMLLYFLSTEKDMPSEYMEILLDQLTEYRMSDGGFSDDKDYVRHDAHLLLGMSYYLFRP
jgi:hypothetical protein